MVVVIDSRADFAQEKIILAKLKKYHIGVLGISVVAIVFLIWACVATAFHFTAKPVENLPPNPRANSNKFISSAVVSDSGFCAEIARNIVIQGGNAVDAAIASTFCNGVVLPYATGLGGGGFMLIYLKSQQKCVFLNSRETAPSSAHPQMYADDEESAQFGYGSIATPGELHGLWTAYKLYGSKVVSWFDIVMPSVKLAQGFPVHQAIYNYFDRIQQFSNRYEAQPILKLFTNPTTKQFYKVGDIISNIPLSKTLEKIAYSSDPVSLFYKNGTFAQQIADEMNQNRGYVKINDLSSYTTDVTEALYSEVAGYRMCGPPPPSSWVITQLIPRVVEDLFFNKNVFNDANFYHILIEAEKLAYGLRGSLGDRLFSSYSDELAKNMTKREFVEQLSHRLPKSAQNVSFYFRAPEAVNDAGTSHTSIIDDIGNAVAMTTSLNMAFGSKMLSQLGFIYNNQMDDFSTPGLVNHWGFEPSVANSIHPGRRPMSSMSPTIVFSADTGDVQMVTGATGGSKIISATAQTIVRATILQQSAAEIVEFPRVHNQLTPPETFVESGFSEKIAEKLTVSFGQNIKISRDPLAIVYPITRDQDRLTAATDFRRKSNNKPEGW